MPTPVKPTPLKAPVTTPVWPYPDITPMHAHRATGQWRRRHKGKDYYFGPLDKPGDALNRWRTIWPSVVAGRPVKLVRDDGASTGLLAACEAFLDDKAAQYERKELSASSLYDYELTCRRICKAVDPGKPIHLLSPHDFDAIMDGMKNLSPVTRGVWVVRVRTVFRWMTDRYGVAIKIPAGFRGPPMRLRRQQRESLQGKLYEPATIHRLIALAGPTLRAAILLGINGGYGPSDLGATLRKEYDPHKRIISHRRQKTGEMRRVPVWPETADAIAAASVPGSEKLLVWANGKPISTGRTNQLTRVFHALALGAEIDNTMYGLRYTFATVAAEVGDDHARHIIMGHAIHDVPSGYVLRFPVKRLQAVTDHVRQWLYGAAAPA